MSKNEIIIGSKINVSGDLSPEQRLNSSKSDDLEKYGEGKMLTMSFESSKMEPMMSHNNDSSEVTSPAGSSNKKKIRKW